MIVGITVQVISSASLCAGRRLRLVTGAVPVLDDEVDHGAGDPEEEEDREPEHRVVHQVGVIGREVHGLGHPEVAALEVLDLLVDQDVVPLPGGDRAVLTRLGVVEEHPVAIEPQAPGLAGRDLQAGAGRVVGGGADSRRHRELHDAAGGDLAVDHAVERARGRGGLARHLDDRRLAGRGRRGGSGTGGFRGRRRGGSCTGGFRGRRRGGSGGGRGGSSGRRGRSGGGRGGRACGGRGARRPGAATRGGALVRLRDRGSCRGRVRRLRRGLRRRLGICRRGVEHVDGEAQGDRRGHCDRGRVAKDGSHVTPLGAAGGRFPRRARCIKPSAESRAMAKPAAPIRSASTPARAWLLASGS